MNNEPVAWMELYYGEPNNLSWTDAELRDSGEVYKTVPLYTHPVKYCPSEDNAAYEKGFIDGMAKMTESAVHCAVEGMAVKELTDEEIRTIQAICHLKNVGYDNFIMRFARAILRKAQEETMQSVMAQHCTCYKLGYSPLNDYALVKQK